MATTSITKQYVVKDKKTFDDLLKAVEKISKRKTIENDSDSLSKGREVLKHFSPI